MVYCAAYVLYEDADLDAGRVELTLVACRILDAESTFVLGEALER